MPTNKRESLIYTVLMCFVMVLWMSVYNVAMQYGRLSIEVIRDAWLGFPVAYVFAMCCDWFLVSGLAKGFAFRFLVKPEDTPFKKVICISCCMEQVRASRWSPWSSSCLFTEPARVRCTPVPGPMYPCAG